MLSKTAIHSRQLIYMMVITRISLSYAFIASISPGNNIQDILLAVPVVFAVDLLVFVPLLMLMKRHPGKDITGCSRQIFGSAVGNAVSFLYFLYFIGIATILLVLFQQFYYSTTEVQADSFALALPIIAVAAYGAIKGIESISRVSLLVLIFYILVVVIINIALFPNINLGYLKPMMFSGPRVFLLSVLAGVSSSFQILILAMCTPYLSPKSSVFKITSIWALLSLIAYGLMQFNVVTVLGPFGGKQLFPYKTLAIYSTVKPFERLDAFLMIAWVIDCVFGLTLYIYLASQCLMHTELRKFRRSTIVVTALIIFAAGQFAYPQYIKYLRLFIGAEFAVVFAVMVFLIPLIMLITDVVKEKVANLSESK